MDSPPIPPSLATKETQKSPKKDELVAVPEPNIPPPAMWTPPPIPPSLAALTPSDALQDDIPDYEQNIPPKSTKKDELLAASESSTALLQPSTAPSPHDETPPATLVSSTLAASTASDAGPLDSTQEDPLMQKDNPDSSDNLPDQSSKNDFSTAESSTAPLPPSDLLPSSTVSPPLAASTTLALDSSQDNMDLKGNQPDTEQESDVGASAAKPPSQLPSTSTVTPGCDSSHENINVQVDKPDSEPENDEGDDSVLPKTPKYRIGTFVIKEVDDISCTGVIHRVVFDQNTFLYSVRLGEVDLEETIDEDEMKKYVFYSDDWIVMKDMDVFVTVGTTDHPAKIDSIVRLSDDLVDTKSLRVRWGSNGQKEVVDISSVKPMYSSENHVGKRSEKPEKTKKEKQTGSITSSHTQKTVYDSIEDLSCPRKLLVGLSYECKHYINCISHFAKQKTAKRVEKSKKMPQELVTFRDNFRLYKQQLSQLSPPSLTTFEVWLTTGMELYKEEDFMDSVIKECDRLSVKLSPQSCRAKALCLMEYSFKKAESDHELNMNEVPIVYGPLYSFIDRDDQVDLELSCLSQMSITIIFVPNFNIHPVLFNFISELSSEGKDEIDEWKFKHALIAVHGPYISETSHLVQALSSGYVNFIQVYDVMIGYIFSSECVNKELPFRRCPTDFPVVGSLETFLENLGTLFATLVMTGVASDPAEIEILYQKPVKVLLAEYLTECTTPAPFSWLNLYLEKIRSKIFSMDNLLDKFVTPDGHEVYGLRIDSILDNIFKFGGKHERYNRSHRMWASSNCSIESVFASAMVIYKEVSSGTFRFFCRCCQKNVHSSSSPNYNSLHDIMLAIPYVSITHRLAKRFRLASTGLVKDEPEDFYFQEDFRLHPKHLQGMEMDNTVVECIPDSSKIDNIIGDDSLILSAIKNDIDERCMETARSWKSVVTCIFGTDEGLSQKEPPLLLQQDDEALQGENDSKSGTLLHDHEVLQEKMEKVIDGGDVKALFPISHNEKKLYLEDTEENKDNWKSEIDHVEGLLASRAMSVTRVDWKDSGFPCHMPKDINFLLKKEDINHLDNILQDDKNDFRFFHQLGLLPAYLQVARQGNDDAHKYRRIPKIAHQYAFECSNGCENIFTKEGRSKTIKDSNVYVMTSEVNAADYKKLLNVSTFLKGEEFYHLVAEYPKKPKHVQWVASEEVQSYLEEDLAFFDGLEHNIEKELPDKVKKKLKQHFMMLEEKYEMPSSFQLTLLHPFLAYLQLNVGDNDNHCSFGFADTQNAIATAFVYDSIPYMKTIERMTNPCFQETSFATVMKGKHVLNQPDEPDLESDHVEESSGQVIGGDREEEITFERNQGEHSEEHQSGSEPLSALLSQATQAEPRTSTEPRRGKRLRVQTNKFTFGLNAPVRSKYTPDNDCSPPVSNSSILLPIQVTREKSNCAFGNAVNLLTYINHFNTGLKQKMLTLGSQTKGCHFVEIQTLIHQCGYDIMVLPSITTFTELESFVIKMGIPMLINLELKFPFITYGHVIGISPYKSSERSQIEYHIIDGAHPEMKAMYFNEENIDWCCGNDLKLEKINLGFGFVPGRKRVLEMFNDKSRYHVVKGTAVCLTRTIKKKGKEKEELDAIERMLALNVCNKEKSEYVKIWKQLMDECKKKK